MILLPGRRKQHWQRLWRKPLSLVLRPASLRDFAMCNLNSASLVSRTSGNSESGIIGFVNFLAPFFVSVVTCLRHSRKIHVYSLGLSLLLMNWLTIKNRRQLYPVERSESSMTVMSSWVRGGNDSCSLMEVSCVGFTITLHGLSGHSSLEPRPSVWPLSLHWPLHCSVLYDPLALI